MTSFNPRTLTEDEIRQIPVMTNELLGRSIITSVLLAGSVIGCASVITSIDYMLDHLGLLIRGYGILSWVVAIVVGMVAGTVSWYLLVLPAFLSFAIMRRADEQIGMGEFVKDILPFLSISTLIAIIKRFTLPWFCVIVILMVGAAVSRIMDPASLSTSAVGVITRIVNMVGSTVVYCIGAVVIMRGTFSIILVRYYDCPVSVATFIGNKAIQVNPGLLVEKAMIYQLMCLSITTVGFIFSDNVYFGALVLVATHGLALYFAVKMYAQMPIAFREIFFGTGNTKLRQKQTFRNLVPVTQS